MRKDPLAIKVHELITSIVPSVCVISWSQQKKTGPIRELLSQYEEISSRDEKNTINAKWYAAFMCIVILLFFAIVYNFIPAIVGMIMIGTFGLFCVWRELNFGIRWRKKFSIRKEIEAVLLEFVRDVEIISPPSEYEGLMIGGDNIPIPDSVRINAFKYGVAREKLITHAMNKTTALGKFDRLRLLPARMLDAIMEAGRQVRKAELEFNGIWDAAQAFSLTEFCTKGGIFDEAFTRLKTQEEKKEKKK